MRNLQAIFCCALLVAGLPVTAQTVYEQQFNDEASFRTMTVIDSNNDSVTWMYKYSYGEGYAQCQFKNGTASDDWLITPDIHLEAGVRYKLSFSAMGQLSSWYGSMKVAYGTGDNPSAYTQILNLPEIPGSSAGYWNQYFKNIDITETGNYRFGFHAVTPGDQYRLNLDSIRIVVEAKGSSPAAVTHLTATAGALGALSDTIRFVSPIEDIDGNVITSMSKIEVLRNGDEIHTFNNPQTGTYFTYVDNAPAAGFNTYTIIPYNSSGIGKKDSVTVFVGEDAPSKPLNVHLYDDLNGKLRITWDNPVGPGKNGGYVDNSNLTYNIYRVKATEYEERAYNYKKNITGNELHIDTTFSQYQDILYYAITASNASGESDFERTSRIITGDPYTLPFHESFPEGVPDNDMWWTETSDATGNSTFVVNTRYSSTNDGGCVRWEPSYGGLDSWLNTGKITLAGSTSPVLWFYYDIYAGSDTKLQVEIDRATQNLDTMLTIQVPGNAGWGWKRADIDLSKYKDDPYIIVKFHGISGNDHENIYLDNINIRANSTTAITGIHTDDGQKVDSPVFNLIGQRVAPESKGVVIMNGKKIINK